MTHIGIIIGSTRPLRRGAAVGRWVFEEANRLDLPDVDFELVDLSDYDLPVLDEPVAGIVGDYRHTHTQRWADAIASFDGFVFVTPEYNHAAPGGLKNAIDYLFAEWNDKAAGFVSYGTHGGVRAVENLRLVLAEVLTATVRSQVALSVYTDFDYAGTDPADPSVTGRLRPADHHRNDLAEMLAELAAWAVALRGVRRTEEALLP